MFVRLHRGGHRTSKHNVHSYLLTGMIKTVQDHLVRLTYIGQPQRVALDCYFPATVLLQYYPSCTVLQGFKEMEHKKKAEKHKVLKSSDAKRQQLPKKKKKNMQRESLAGHIHKVLKSVHAGTI